MANNCVPMGWLVAASMFGLTIGCGGDDDGGDGNPPVPDAAATPDAVPIPDTQINPDATAVTQCDVLDLEYDLTGANYSGHEFAQAPGSALRYYSVGTVVDFGPPQDLFTIDLWPGFGAFQGGQPVPGTFPIAGPETDLDTCGVCVVMRGDFNAVDLTFERFLLAVSGTVTLSVAEPMVGGQITGTATDLVLTEFDPLNGTRVPGGCGARVNNVTFDVTVVAPSSAPAAPAKVAYDDYQVPAKRRPR